MHDGRYATLHDVVRHYSDLDEERQHADRERILKPLRLTPAERDDLVAFLESLSEMASRGHPHRALPVTAPEIYTFVPSNSLRCLSS
jgi:cytochrome c peroxidase